MLAECVERNRNSPASEQIFRLSRLFGQNCGFERSLKLSGGHLDASRFLISASLDGISPPVLARMFEALTHIGIPAAFADEMKSRIGQASFIHFGYEEGRSGPVCKTYLEFDAPNGDAAHPLVHASFKWEMGSSAGGAADEYRRLPVLDEAALDALLERHAALLPAKDAPFAEACRNMIGFLRSRSSLPARDLYVLEVRRREGGRASFDLRTYEFDCTLAEIAPLIQPLVGAAHMPLFASHMREHGHAALGHVAFGTGSDGRAFATLYHGAKELA